MTVVIRTRAISINGAIIFKSADAMIAALGFADPDPEFTRIYQKAHCENENRKAEAAYQNVAQYVKSRDWSK